MKSKVLEVYYDEDQVIERINQLKQMGYDEEEMYIIVNNSEEYDIEELEEITDVEVKDEETTLDVFKNLITGGDSLLDIFEDLDLDDEDRDFYYRGLENGDILLYIGRDYIGVEDMDMETYEEELFDDIEDNEEVIDDEEYIEYHDMDEERDNF